MSATLTRAGSQPLAAPVASARVATDHSSVAADARVPLASAAQRTKAPRDGFLDALRAVAIIRVVLWHAFGTPWLSWVVATMPLMFFVAGSLLHASLEARPAAEVLRSRLRRLMLPFWLFAAIVLGFLSIVHLSNPGPTTGFSPEQLLSWVVPLVNPTASVWEAGWASSPLWYIRAYLWLLLLSPVLLAAWRRFGVALLPVPLIVMMAGEMLARSADPGPNSGIWLIGDLGIYAFFVLLGFAHANGAFDDLDTRALIEWLIVGATATFVAWQFFPAESGVINHSYPTLWASGIAWIAVAFLARPILSVLPRVRIVGGILYWMTRRAMSIYLWHSPAIVASYLLAARLNLDATPAVVLAMVVVLVVLAVVLTGWVEDIAGGKPAEIWPTQATEKVTVRDTIGHIVPARRHGLVGALAAGAAVTLIALAAVAPAAPISAAQEGQAPTSPSSPDGDVGAALPPAPSGRPDPQAGTTSEPSDDAAGVALPPAPSGRPDPQAANDVEVESGTASVAAAPSAAGADELTAFAEQWLTTAGISGVRVAVSMPDGERMFAGAGVDADGDPMIIDGAEAVTSVTKTMTGALVMQLVDEGLLELDAPMTSIPGAGDLSAATPITIRQLLNHSSGLAPYQETPGYDPNSTLDPVAAVQLALATDLQWAPGSAAGYSNSGFLALGLIIEAATGQSYEAALSERILEPFGLGETSVDTTPRLGWIGDSAGGVSSSVEDLATWGAHLYRDGDVVTPASLLEMTTIDAALYSGLATFPVCPCQPGEPGTVSALSYGHNGGSVTLQFSPGDGIVIAAGFSESFWLGGFGQADVYEFLAEVRRVVGG
ncbi:MAG: serine hydrolase [Ilumatobacter sp.]